MIPDTTRRARHSHIVYLNDSLKNGRILRPRPWLCFGALLGSDSHFFTCAIYNANTFSFVPSPAVKTGHPHLGFCREPYNSGAARLQSSTSHVCLNGQSTLAKWWRCRDSNPGPNGFFNAINKSILQARLDSNQQPPVLETGILPIELLTYIAARFPIQPAPKATCRFICLIKHGLVILMSSRRERDSNPRPTSRRVKD